jgi:hypothetical protein
VTAVGNIYPPRQGRIYPPRQGRPAPGGPFEGVPDHFRCQLERWLHDIYIDDVTRKYENKAMERLAALVHIDIQGTSKAHLRRNPRVVRLRP